MAEDTGPEQVAEEAGNRKVAYGARHLKEAEGARHLKSTEGCKTSKSSQGHKRFTTRQTRSTCKKKQPQQLKQVGDAFGYKELECSTSKSGKTRNTLHHKGYKKL